MSNSRGLQVVSDKKLIRFLEDHGWYLARQKGSHRHFKHPTQKGTVTIPYNCTRNVILQIRRQTGLDTKDLV